MEAPNLRDPLCEEQVAELLGKGGASQQLDDCECLVLCLNYLVGYDLKRRQRQAALHELVEEVLDTDNDNAQLLAAREYLGWATHSYGEVIDAATEAGMTHVEALDQRATDEERRQHRDRLLSNFSVREVFVGRRLRPGDGLTVRTVRKRRPQIARAFLRAIAEFLDDTPRVEAFVDKVKTTSSASTVSREIENRDARPADSTQRDPASGTRGTLFTAVDSETLFVIGSQGQRTIYINRRIRSETDSLSEFYDYYSGSGDPSIGYHFRAEYGCDLKEQSLNNQGRLTGRFRLSKALSRGDEHTIRYHIGRTSHADERPEYKTWVLSLYTDESPTLRERMLVRFCGSQPSRVWCQITGSSSRIPDSWTAEHNLNTDGEGCVEWVLPDMKTNLHYVICWEMPDRPDGVVG